MKKRFLQFRMMAKAVMITLLLSVAGLMNGNGQSFTVGNLYYSINSDQVSVTVTGHLYGSAATGTLSIPESVNYYGITYSVTEIDNGAFSDCSGLTGSLTIPNSVVYIGARAFNNCSGFMGNLIIGNSVTTIGSRAFYNCSGFTGTLVIPNYVTSIGSSAFSYCSGFSEVHYNATNCADATDSSKIFYGCGGTLVIGDNVERIPAYMFDSCNGFTGSLTIPNFVTTIGSHAFQYCNGFRGNLTIGNSVTMIDDFAFANCLHFTGSLIIPNSVIVIGNGAFSTCRDFIGNLIIGNSVATIGNNAFKNCSGFTGSLTIPNSVTTIGWSAFNGCTSFTGTLTIGDSVTSIDSDAFNGCSSFTGSLNIPNSVTSIGVGSFSHCSGFTGNLTIPNSLTEISGSAFFGCSGFTGNLIIPNSVVIIGDWAFYGCSGFTGSLTISNSAYTIGTYAFSNCGFTGSLVIPKYVSTIKSGAFNGCNGLTDVMICRTSPPSLMYYNVFDNTDFPLYVPYESIDAYKEASYWNSYESRIYGWLQKNILGYGESNGNWQFIASPLVENTNPTTVDNMITETAYDLYRFDQSEEAEWRNYKAHTNDFTLANGQGYLYANAEDVNLIFKGEFNEGETKEVGLAYDANATFAGWNLVGNPFPVSAYVDRSYYVMNEDGTAIEPVAVSMETAIPVCTGVMVKADAAGETVTFSKTAPEAVGNQGVLQIAVAQANTRGNAVEDKVIVSFNANDHLEKFIFNKDNAQISITQDSKDLAIASARRIGEMPLNFKASRNGQYTISVNPENVEMDYLHLIDNMTGANVDLLVTPNYTFTAKASDYASRFRLVFVASSVFGDEDGDNENFAFISNGDIIINGEGTLQMIDMTGHIIVSVDGRTRCIPTSGMIAGVYVLRLIDGNDVRTQKIVVR